MGLVQSSICTYSKADFKTRMAVTKDAHDLFSFFNETLTDNPNAPISLERYPKFSSLSELYFNSRRKENLGKLTSINPKISNFYELAKSLEGLETEYERTDITSSERKAKLTEIKDLMWAAIQILAEEFALSCQKA